jgi:hypothetical protein
MFAGLKQRHFSLAKPHSPGAHLGPYLQELLALSAAARLLTAASICPVNIHTICMAAGMLWI